MSLELKRCPFCESAAVAHGIWGDRRMSVRCMGCDASGPSTDQFPEVCVDIGRFIDHADAAWNQRSDAARQEGARGGEPVEHAPDCQSHIVDVRGRPDECTCGALASPAEPSGWTQAREFVRFVGRLDHTGDDGWVPGGDEDSCVLDNLIARARDIMASLPPTSEGGGA